MLETPTTRASLLVRLRDCNDRQAWEQFVDVYAPLIHAFLRQHGVQDADASDLTQEVLQKVCQASPGFNYDPSKGHFRGWLFTLVRNSLVDFARKRGIREQAAGGTSMVEFLNAQPKHDEELSAGWDLAWMKQMFARAAAVVREQVQPVTWQSFWMTAVEGKEVTEVAAQLGQTTASVYLARSRVMARLKEQIRQWQEE
jgi:RNA polymerase sigma-70 factor (ECF subfamily)